MKRRRLLAALGAGCAHCAAQAQGSTWLAPSRFSKPEPGSDEGGLWAMMDREETRLRRSPFVLRDAPLRDYLQDMACKLGGEHCADVRVYPVRTPFFNASMAPNGMMQIWSGLLLRVDNEAQLAAVVGHEIGHYMQRHTLERLRDVKARSAFGMFMGMFGVVGLVGQMASLAGAFGFSRDQEREADRIGLELMRKAGYDTREASKVWEHLRAEAAAAHEPAKSSPMFATHPPSDERSATLAQLAMADSGGFVGAAELSGRLAGLQQMMLEDELRRGQHGETLVLLDRLIARSPQRSDLLYFRGETRRQRATGDDTDRALQDFEQALQLGQEPAQLHRALGYLYQAREQPQRARQAFGRYVELAPEAADAALIKSFL
ncbi:M48 family metallopeptidase [Paucibacter sp. PLA-PC-4]|uniref:M48 family metallopeptidase n=1 Tax=Paucibacter sp. PLA-PC-4 TaxID=2993655 RepID=UPI00224AEFDA|nr:M48 family metallopeptidase [Paucibacter sp. PLA-PC-4]MCX2863912.1 M48 family metallopeptidase [Paucibacter sp. PLA-PC-4]